MDFLQIILIIIVIVVAMIILLRYFQHIKRGSFRGGNNEEKARIDIIEFLRSAPIAEIQAELQNNMNNRDICDETIGVGTSGVVIRSNIGHTMTVKLGEKIVYMPVVAKLPRDNKQAELNMAIVNKKLYIYSRDGLNTEAIIMLAAREFWPNNPHIHLMLNYSNCVGHSVNRIMTELHGLPGEIEYNKNYVNILPLWNERASQRTITRLATLGDLVEYINVHGADLTLPNGAKCSASALIDQFVISYLHTHEYMYKRGIILLDMHIENIFIHWQNNASFMGEKSLEHVKKISYDFGEFIAEIDTFGMILKMGDIGHAIYIARDDVIVVGNCVDAQLAAHIIENDLTLNYTCRNFINMFLSRLPLDIIKDTVSQSILTSRPYDKFAWNPQIKLVGDLMSPREIISKFTQYIVKAPSDGAIIVA